MPMIYRIVPHLYMVCRSLQEVHNISKQSREVVVVLLILVVSYCCIIAWLAALDRNQHALGVNIPVMICIRSGSVFTNSDLPILFYNLCMQKKFTLQKVAIKAHQILTHKQFLLLFHIFCFVDSEGEKCIRSGFTSDISVNIIVPPTFLHMQKCTSKCAQQILTQFRSSSY
jgi:hypothetical protein